MRIPSGDHVGHRARCPSGVIGLASDPSAFITTIRLTPFSADAQAIRRPSRDHAGWKFSAVPSVNWRTVAPSGDTSEICRLPSTVDTNATDFPSGDHAGSQPPCCVSRTRWVPSSATLSIFQSPPASLAAKAMAFPSGAQTGLSYCVCARAADPRIARAIPPIFATASASHAGRLGYNILTRQPALSRRANEIHRRNCFGYYP